MSNIKPRSNIKPLSIVLQLAMSLGQGIESSPISRARLRRIVLANLSTAQKPLRTGAVVHLRLCDTKEAKVLNRAHRDKAYAPNVLTFEYPRVPGQPMQADIAICLPVVHKEALQQHKTIEHHFIHLLVHGCLHAVGFDHLDEGEAQIMENLERQVLKRFRIADPYQVAP
jgi:probable rRNA maturation factor